MPRRVLHLGPYQPVLEEALLREVRGVRENDSLQPIVVLVPTAFLRQHLKRTLAVRLGGHSGIRFVTVSELARDVAERAMRSQGLAGIPDAAATVLWRRAAAQLPADAFFGPIAKTHGFPSALRSTIRDLKEAGLTPNVIRRRAVGNTRLARKLRELAEVWSKVEEAQAAAGFHDSLDLLREAGELAPDAPLLDGAATFVYGFYDLTRAQRRLVTGFLHGRAVAAAFMPHGPDDPDETFAYSGATIDFFQGPAIGLFREDDAAPIPSKAPPAWRVVAAPGEGREAREVARVAAFAPGALHETGVILRAASSQAPLIDEALEQAGVARTIELTALRETSARAFRLLVDAVTLDLPRRQVIEILTTLPVRFEDFLGRSSREIAPGIWDVLSREWGIVSGAKEWLERVAAGIEELERVLERAERDGEEEQVRDAAGEQARGGARGRLGKARALAKMIEVIAREVQSIPQAGPWSAVAGALRSSFVTLFDFGKPDRPEDDPDADRWERLREALDEIGRLDALAVQDPALGKTTLAEVAELVEEALGDARVRAGKLESTGVLVADLMKARGLPFRTVIVPGMIEGLFPRVARPDPLLGDGERRSLNKVFDLADTPFEDGDFATVDEADLGPDGPIPLKGASAREERLLFRLCLDAASEEVVFTLPRLDPATARDRIPSWLLMRLVGGAREPGSPAITVEKFASHARVEWLPLDPAPRRRDRALTRLERDLSDLAGALAPGLDDGSRIRKAATLVLRSRFGKDVVRAENARWGSGRFTEFDGWLAPPPAAAGTWIEGLARVGFRANREISASRLETWSTCPYKYFLQYGLGLSALEEPERTMTLEPTDRGQLIHDALERFWRTESEAHRLPLATADTAPALDRVEAIAHTVLGEFAARGVTGPAVLWRSARGEIVADLRESVRRTIADAAGFVPRRFEVTFGTVPPEDGDDTIGGVTLGGQYPLGFRGRIDRIDVSADGRRGRVVDYKTGKAHKTPKPGKKESEDPQAPLPAYEPIFEGGQALQRPLYVLAAKAAFPEVAEWEAVYDFCTQRGGFEADPVKVTAETLSALGQLVQGIAADAEAGHYPFVPDVTKQCKWCDFREVCGPGHDIAYESKEDFPDLVRLLRRKEEFR